MVRFSEKIAYFWWWNHIFFIPFNPINIHNIQYIQWIPIRIPSNPMKSMEFLMIRFPPKNMVFLQVQISQSAQSRGSALRSTRSIETFGRDCWRFVWMFFWRFRGRFRISGMFFGDFIRGFLEILLVFLCSLLFKIIQVLLRFFRSVRICQFWYFGRVLTGNHRWMLNYDFQPPNKWRFGHHYQDSWRDLNHVQNLLANTNGELGTKKVKFEHRTWGLHTDMET